MMVGLSVYSGYYPEHLLETGVFVPLTRGKEGVSDMRDMRDMRDVRILFLLFFSLSEVRGRDRKALSRRVALASPLLLAWKGWFI